MTTVTGIIEGLFILALLNLGVTLPMIVHNKIWMIRFNEASKRLDQRIEELEIENELFLEQLNKPTDDQSDQ